MAGRVVAVNVGQARDADWVARRVERTAIDKRPVEGPVEVGTLGLAGDEHAYAGHGGVYQAVYAYADEDAYFWEAELGHPLWPGAFGENLTTAAVDVSRAVVGERWRVGPVVLEATGPRIPCNTFAGWWDMPDLVKRFTAAGRPGAYLRVIETGLVRAGDPVDVISRPDHGVTVADLLAARTGDRSLLPRIRAVPDLAPKWREWLASIDRVKAAG
jgi:MOSC domain-containing protein YiiM